MRNEFEEIVINICIMLTGAVMMLGFLSIAGRLC